VNLAQRRPLAFGGTGSRLDLCLHDPLGREGQHLADQISISLLFNQLEQSHSVVGHRRLHLVQGFPTRTYSEDRR